jgi:hypothetical protein
LRKSRGNSRSGAAVVIATYAEDSKSLAVSYDLRQDWILGPIWTASFIEKCVPERIELR